MKISLFTCSVNLNRTNSHLCLLRSGPLREKDLPANKEETHPSYLRNQSFTMYKNSQASQQAHHQSLVHEKVYSRETRGWGGGNPRRKQCKIQGIAVVERELKVVKTYEKKLRDSLKQHRFSDLWLYFLLGLQSHTLVLQ